MRKLWMSRRRVCFRHLESWSTQAKAKRAMRSPAQKTAGGDGLARAAQLHVCMTRTRPSNTPCQEEALQRYVAAQLAYTNLGRLLEAVGRLEQLLQVGGGSCSDLRLEDV
jgi:hypothetical protein